MRAFVPIAGTTPRLELMGAFKAKTPVEIDPAAVKQLVGSREDLERPIKFDVPVDGPQPLEPQQIPLPDGSIEFGTGEEAPENPPPSDVGSYAPSEGMEDAVPGDLELENGSGENDEDMEVDLEEGDAPMEEGLTWLQEFGLACLFYGPDLRVSAASSGAQKVEEDLWFSQKFGGTKIWVKVPANVVCEVSGAVLSQKDVMAGMKLELEELDAFSVATIIDEVIARKTATRRIHTTRWVITSKPSKENPNRVRARLVVRDYALGSSPLSEGMYSPTTSLEALRSVLAIHAAKGGTLLSADVSVAFMQAPVEGVEVIRFPAGMSDDRGKPLFARLHKAMYEWPPCWTAVVVLGVYSTFEGAGFYSIS